MTIQDKIENLTIIEIQDLIGAKKVVNFANLGGGVYDMIATRVDGQVQRITIGVAKTPEHEVVFNTHKTENIEL